MSLTLGDRNRSARCSFRVPRVIHCLTHRALRGKGAAATLKAGIPPLALHSLPNLSGFQAHRGEAPCPLGCHTAWNGRQSAEAGILPCSAAPTGRRGRASPLRACSSSGRVAAARARASREKPSRAAVGLRYQTLLPLSPVLQDKVG